MTAESAARADAIKRMSGISSWHPDCYQRAVAYLTDPAGRLLVFDHVDVDAGTQVPAGGIHEGEAPDEAVRREVFEETGIDHAVLVRKLGEAWSRSEPGNVPAGFEEQIHHAFHLRLPESSPHETWEWDEKSGGDTVEQRFAFRWVSLQEAARVLWPAQAMWTTAVALSLRHL